MPWLVHKSPGAKLYVGRTLREGPKGLEELSGYFHMAGYSVYMPYDNDVHSDPAEIKARDLEAIRSCDVVVLELNETSLGVAKELGAARAVGKPVILITESERVKSRNWVRGDKGITVCRSKEEAISTLKSPILTLSST